MLEVETMDIPKRLKHVLREMDLDNSGTREGRRWRGKKDGNNHVWLPKSSAWKVLSTWPLFLFGFLINVFFGL